MSKQAEYSSKWYNNNKQLQKQRVDSRRREMTQFLFSLKKNKKCAFCSESEPACLDWHHTRDKIVDVSQIPKMGWGKEKALEEISKCILVCANCHRKLHAGL